MNYYVEINSVAGRSQMEIMGPQLKRFLGHVEEGYAWLREHVQPGDIILEYCASRLTAEYDYKELWSVEIGYAAMSDRGFTWVDGAHGVSAVVDHKTKEVYVGYWYDDGFRDYQDAALEWDLNYGEIIKVGHFYCLFVGEKTTVTDGAYAIGKHVVDSVPGPYRIRVV